MLTPYLSWFKLGTFDVLFCKIVCRPSSVRNKTYYSGSPMGAQPVPTCLVNRWESEQTTYIDKLIKVWGRGSGPH